VRCIAITIVVSPYVDDVAVNARLVVVKESCQWIEKQETIDSRQRN